ncbi:efflux transporter periplasmic adaptor subunit [Scytonema hofmannii PCC 7110]|uniref:Efflux transporter periplasmic adaptor subunit n=1 Tax=Scytonema hofmannii PCC 7110 TaxID=128403 RepID=A0A139WZS0_9CYAN|nr:efflux RND transporter periplasmic adaptor subunit [Scytonema hofmannii]KYC37955.1 efflux transporter periplasmic adaptor subunit [Scytonema hofmannii PCC 7110]
MNTVYKRSRARSQWVLSVTTILILIGTVSLGAIGWSRRQTTSKPNLTHLTVSVQTKALTIRVEASGRVQPIKTVNIGSEVSGRLVARYVDRGDRVKAGQILARMRTAEKEATLAQSKGQLAEAEAEYNKVRNGNRKEEISRAKAQVASAQAQLNFSTKKLERYRWLAREGAISQMNLDEFIKEEQSARASLQEALQRLQELTSGSRPEDIQQAAAKVTAARAKIKEIQAQLDASVIRAPFDGIVTQIYADVGAIVTPNAISSTTTSATSSSILELASGLEVLVDVPEANISQIKVGQKVKLIADSYPNRTFEGRLLKIAPKAEVEDNVTTFQVRVQLVTGQSYLRSGMNVDAIFISQSTPNALMVPTVAITTRDNHMGVLVADRQGETRFQPIKVGVTQDGQTQIIKGLKQGERVFVDFPEGKTPQTSVN